MKKFQLFCFTTLIVLTANFAFAMETKKSKDIDDYIIMTENYPPYSYKENEKLLGISSEILGLLLDKLDANKTLEDVKVMPWEKVYLETQRVPHTMVFSMSRIQEREKLFKWVGPIIESNIAFIAKFSLDVNLNNLSSSRYKIGVVKGDVGRSLLEKRQYNSKFISESNEIKNVIDQLAKDRVDLIVYDTNVFFWTVKNMGGNPEDYKIVSSLDKVDLYFAFNVHTPQEMIDNLNDTMKKIKETNNYKKILKKYDVKG